MCSISTPSVVLVHGAFVDGSGWRPVYDFLTHDGYHVAVVQNPTVSLQGDAAATRLIIDMQPGPVVLVGHSYGGAVITEAGTNPKVAALVYISAFAPDKDESVNTLIGRFPCHTPRMRGLPLGMASSSRTPSCSTHRLVPTSPTTWRRSWPTRSPRGARVPPPARSRTLPGGIGRAGTWSRPTKRKSPLRPNVPCLGVPDRRSSSLQPLTPCTSRNRLL
jgi:pimeloyl-ACP methyl ester carboxylesterase